MRLLGKILRFVSYHGRWLTSIKPKLRMASDGIWNTLLRVLHFTVTFMPEIPINGFENFICDFALSLPLGHRIWGNFNLVARPCSLIVGSRTKYDCPITVRAVSCWHNLILKFSLKAAIGTRLLLHVCDWCFVSQSVLGYKEHHRLEGLSHGDLCPHSSGSWYSR